MIIHIGNILLALILLSVLLSLRTNRLMALVKLMAFQGIMVSTVPLFSSSEHEITFGLVLFFLFMVLVKGLCIPVMMAVAVKRVIADREIEPIIGYHASLFAGLIMIVFSMYLINHLQLSLLLPGHRLLLVTAVTTMGAGLILLMARRKAITQVIGYLMMENGIYLIGTALAGKIHHQYLVEFSILLDLLVAVLVMGIVLNDIHHTFDDVDTGLMGRLKD